ncbi:pyridoxal phosphate-dependent transferase [Aspergillus karnatakaensis]|uniref:pyridoxal phosphate-dependent transferase n=1 Tax=Aspergillus karnatakaensis TaxID=1810916 RepID=UPI003CCCCFE5
MATDASQGSICIGSQVPTGHEPLKVNLGIGAYRDDHGKPWQLSCVQTARKQLADGEWLHEYLPLNGDAEFVDLAQKLLFGAELPAGAISSVQSVSGTGANSTFATIAGQIAASHQQVWFPNLTWDNHYHIWRENAPAIHQRNYPYFDPVRMCLDFDAMMTTLRQDAREGDFILLHACAHNPTGLDPTRDQWREIARLCLEKRLFVVFDVAYQGFATGNLDQDAWAVRHFCSYASLEIAACQSFSNNLGLYGERVGILHIVTTRAPTDSTVVSAVRAKLVDVQRASISMAPRFGSQVARLVMSSPKLHRQWELDLLRMSGRITAMRQALYNELQRLATPGDWNHIVEQSGMFSYTGLSTQQVELMQTEYHVHMLPSGRISICRLTCQNVAVISK